MYKTQCLCGTLTCHSSTTKSKGNTVGKQKAPPCVAQELVTAGVHWYLTIMPHSQPTDEKVRVNSCPKAASRYSIVDNSAVGKTEIYHYSTLVTRAFWDCVTRRKTPTLKGDSMKAPMCLLGYRQSQNSPHGRDKFGAFMVDLHGYWALPRAVVDRQPNSRYEITFLSKQSTSFSCK